MTDADHAACIWRQITASLNRQLKKSAQEQGELQETILALRGELAAERARRDDDTSNARERVLAEYERIRFEGGGHGYFLFGAAIALDTTAYDLLNDGDVSDAPEEGEVPM